MTGDSLPATASGVKLCFLFLLKLELVGSAVATVDELGAVVSIVSVLFASKGSIKWLNDGCTSFNWLSSFTVVFNSLDSSESLYVCPLKSCSEDINPF